MDDSGSSPESIAAIGAQMGIDVNGLSTEQVLRLMAQATQMIEEKEKDARTAAEYGELVLERNTQLEKALADAAEQNAKLSEELLTAAQQRDAYKGKCETLLACVHLYAPDSFLARLQLTQLNALCTAVLCCAALCCAVLCV